MADLTTKQLVEVIQRSRLIDKTKLKSTLSQVKEAHGGRIPSQSTVVGQHLVENGLLTKWQYDKLKGGKYKGFFLGKYQLLDHLGSGGMSCVYLADHQLMNRRVAIKVLPPSRVDDKSYLERFYLEAQAVAALDHPNIVRAFDVDCEEDTHYLVMEYVEGEDLMSVVANADRPLQFAVVADYIEQAARGLQHAHHAGLIHRDVKPANLLVDTHGTVKLLDLGLALFESESKSLSEKHQEKVLGTADYLAPEQALNSHEVDARADIYGLGCTMYYLLTGQPPFTEGTLAQRILAHQAKEPVGIRTMRPDCPEALAAICHQMMRKEPAKRVQTAEQVAAALGNWRKASKSHIPVADEMPVIVTDQSGMANAHAPTTDFDPVKIEIQLGSVHRNTPLSKRKRRSSTSRHPPISLWIGLGLLSLVAVGLSLVLLLH